MCQIPKGWRLFLTMKNDSPVFFTACLEHLFMPHCRIFNICQHRKGAIYTVWRHEQHHRREEEGKEESPTALAMIRRKAKLNLTSVEEKEHVVSAVVHWLLTDTRTYTNIRLPSRTCRQPDLQKPIIPRPGTAVPLQQSRS